MKMGLGIRCPEDGEDWFDAMLIQMGYTKNVRALQHKHTPSMLTITLLIMGRSQARCACLADIR